MALLRFGAAPIRYCRDATIVCEGDITEYIFLVVRGVVRSCRAYQDGSRRIVAFHFPGELFWLERRSNTFALRGGGNRCISVVSQTQSRLVKCRVATFLIDLSMRMGNSKYLDLPMSHLDIADHLGLKIETVSRTIAELVKSGSIARASYRALVLRDRASLVRIMNE